MKIGILVAVLGEHDAIGTDAREMGTALARLGHEVRFFATSVRGDAPEIAPPDAIDAFLDSPHDLLIYHFAFGWPPGVDALRRVCCRRVVRYHNVTPPEFFAPWSDNYAATCRAGREEISTLAALGCELYLGDSPFNVEDFLSVGVPHERTAVLAPFNRVDHLIATPADLDLLDDLHGTAAIWLAVGRLAPNKGHLDLFEAFATYLDRCEPDARLVVVGSEDVRLARYNGALHERLQTLGLAAHVRFLCDLDDAGLKAAYLGADVLISLSAHEGFCVPLVEAMALGVPVLALDRGAQAWVVGDAGLVWDNADPALIAASVAHLRTDARLRGLLHERGLERVAHAFAPAVLEAKLAGIIGAFL